MSREWTDDDVLALTRNYQAVCVLVAGAELDVFTALAGGPLSAVEVAERINANIRGVTILLDALAALELLDKSDGRYTLCPGVADALADGRSGGVLPMVLHQGNCLRRWARLAEVIRSGRPAERQPSVRGADADAASFIGAMHVICDPVADSLIASIQQLNFTHALDVGGGSGTWTIALLRSNPTASATIFDLEHVIPLAKKRITDAGLADRVSFAAGDFLADSLPAGVDLALVSAIVHQNSREQNRRLFRSINQALQPGGQILIRDIVMDESRTSPAAGALFAVNMLVATEGGGTFTMAELREDLEAEGFVDVSILRRDDGMNSFVRALTPK